MPRPDSSRVSRRSLPHVEEISAGGLVIDRTTDPVHGLLIAKRDRSGQLVWSMPKGHIEPGETREEAAIREVEEETGVLGKIVGELGTISYWFVAERRRVHKTVHFFLLDKVGGTLSTDDVEVDEVAWIPLAELKDRLRYSDEKRLVSEVDGSLREPVRPEIA